MISIIHTIEALYQAGKITQKVQNELLTVAELELNDLHIKGMDIQIVELTEKVAAIEKQRAMDTECIARITRHGMEMESERDAAKQALEAYMAKLDETQQVRDRLLAGINEAILHLSNSESPFYQGMTKLQELMRPHNPTPIAKV